jgi:hypothetical protein
MTGSKYEPLGRHLATIRFNEWRATFADIEQVLGFRLPASARTHAAWWGNDRQSRSQASAWLEVGWKATQVDVGVGRVVFRRELGTTRGRRYSRLATASSVDGLVPHSWDETQSFECRIGFEWQPLGAVSLDEKGRLAFPNAPSIPAIYRFRIRHNGAEARYIGETENLARRFSNYRTPGLSQQTNVRVNARLLEMMSAGAEVVVSAVVAAWLDRGRGRETADLSSRAVRRMIENAAVWDRAGTDIELLNRERVLSQELPLAPTPVPVSIEPTPQVEGAPIDHVSETESSPGERSRRSWWNWKR